MTVENGLCYYAICSSFPIYANDSNLQGSGVFWVAVTRTGLCFAEASYFHSGNNTQRDLIFNDPLTKDNAPPSGLYLVEWAQTGPSGPSGNAGTQWFFYIMSPT